jgi:phosphoribosylglycinamide formyltransferase 1
VTADATAGAARGCRVVVLLSGTGSTAQALFDAAADPRYPARVVAVGSDRADAQGLDRARAAGLPTFVVAPADFPDRGHWDCALTRAVKVFHPDLVVSAGFMRILGAPFLAEFGGRTVNSHPALLPAFPGAHAVRDALEAGVKVTGCTVHLVDAGVDTGPIVAQHSVDVVDGDDEAGLHERIKVVERALLVDVVARMAGGRWTVDGRKVTFG